MTDAEIEYNNPGNITGQWVLIYHNGEPYGWAAGGVIKQILAIA